MESLIDELRKAAKESFIYSDLLRKTADTLADVQPVKHGRWIDKNPQDKYDPRCICSVCGSVEFPLSRHNYCPNCGAKMDGET